LPVGWNDFLLPAFESLLIILASHTSAVMPVSAVPFFLVACITDTINVPDLEFCWHFQSIQRRLTTSQQESQEGFLLIAKFLSGTGA
jgi:hypothetical protein